MKEKTKKNQKKEITLRYPIKINGKTVSKLTYNFEKITIDDLQDAFAHANGTNDRFVEQDHGVALYLGFYAVIEENKEIDIEDLKRLKGYDLIQLTNLGTLFTIGWEGQTDDSSEETSEPTADASLSAPTKSEKEEQ